MLPLNYICLQRPKNTGDVPRSAWSSAEGERKIGGEEERGLSRERGGRAGEKEEEEERQREDSGSISEQGKQAKPFSISQRDYMGRRAAVLRCLFWFLSLLEDFGRQRERRGERERPHGYLRLQRPLCVALRSSFISRLDREKRERDSHFKRQFDLRSTQEHSLKEDLRKQLKGEYKGHTVTHTGQ